jgi:3',5'-nucleoside bisphosphate phosphatase
VREPYGIPLQSGQKSGWIDLHSHTNESDGTLSPEELVDLAVKTRLDALAITDHDTFAGYEKAAESAKRAGLDLVRGIELNSRLETDGARVRYVHVLAYFPVGAPAETFLKWLATQREERRDRNQRLSQALRDKGIEVAVEEVEARGRSLAGRPHFARVLVEKGYAKNADDAFRRFIGEDAPTFVERQSPSPETVIRLIRESGGVPVVAHPVRLSLPHDDAERRVIERLKEAGLAGLEVFHSEHSQELQSYYLRMAHEMGLLPTGGSDFHGAAKPDIDLGSGRHGNVRVPRSFLDRMRAYASNGGEFAEQA